MSVVALRKAVDCRNQTTKSSSHYAVRFIGIYEWRCIKQQRGKSPK